MQNTNWQKKEATGENYADSLAHCYLHFKISEMGREIGHFAIDSDKFKWI